ncbi:MAG: hypothetical protein ACKOAH_28635, partial [Pirellula sp.]
KLLDAAGVPETDPYDLRPYDLPGFPPLIICDPWFPRTDATRRLGAINPLYPKAFEDDITNYSINGAYQ